MTNPTMRPNVLVSADKLAPDAVAILEEAGYTVRYTSSYPTEEELVSQVHELRPIAILQRHGFITGTVMDAAAPDIRLVARHGAGMDGIDIGAARARSLTVTKAAGANSRSVAEHVMALMLTMLKDLPSIVAGMREGLWEKTSRMTRDVDGMTIGIVGYGAIGSKVARLADAFGMHVLAYDPYVPVLPGPGKRVETLADLLRQSQVLTIHCPLEAETQGMIGAAELALLPHGAVLIQCARGGIVDQDAIIAALDSGQLAWVGVDVFVNEPVESDSPFRAHPRVVSTPHVAANTPRGASGMACGAAESIVAVLAGRLPALEGAVVVPGGIPAHLLSAA